jgi:hypothetical protein
VIVEKGLEGIFLCLGKPRNTAVAFLKLGDAAMGRGGGELSALLFALMSLKKQMRAVRPKLL